MTAIVFGYCRVSTDDQARNGASLDTQQDKIRAWAELHDYSSVRLFSDDGLSGKSILIRPGLQDALDQAKQCAAQGDQAAIVVYSLSRLTRSVKDAITLAEELRDADVQFVSLHEQIDTTTAMGRMFYHIIAALAQLEREQIVERTTDVLAHKRDRGEALGNTPFGFTSDNPKRSIDADRPAMLIVEDREIRVLRRMLALHANGDLSYAAIGRQLTAENLLPRRGNAWDRGTVRKIIKFYDTGYGQELLAALIERRMNNDDNKRICL